MTKQATDTHTLADNARDQAARTRDIAEISRAALVQVQRAFVIPGAQFINIMRADNRNMVESLQIYPQWDNSGSTPTKHFRMHGSEQYMPGEIPSGFDFPDLWNSGEPHVATPAVIGPKGGGGGPKFIVPIAMEELIADRHLRLYMWGWAKYNDVFPRTKTHITEYCWEVLINRVSGEAGKGDELLTSTINCPTRNCYDDECKSE